MGRSIARVPDRRTTRFPPPMTAGEFWALASPVPYLGCWIFVLSHDATPYGLAKVEGVEERAAHRIAYVLATGKKIPPRRLVRHSCDIKGCVNPAHLSVGTHRQNRHDFLRRVRLVRRAARLPAGRLSDHS